MNAEHSVIPKPAITGVPRRTASRSKHELRLKKTAAPKAKAIAFFWLTQSLPVGR